MPEIVPENRKAVPAHTRRVPKTDLANTGDAVPSFDESRVPVETILVMSSEMQQLKPEQFEVIGEKVSYRLAQRPGSTVVLKYVRPQIKILESQAILCAPAPVGVLEGSRADVSFVAGLLVDKWKPRQLRGHLLVLSLNIEKMHVAVQTTSISFGEMRFACTC